GVASAREQSARVITAPPSFAAVADLDARARTFASEDLAGAGWGRVVALPLQQVGPVHGARRDLDEDLPGAGHGVRGVGPFQLFRTTRFAEPDRAHDTTVGHRSGVRRGTLRRMVLDF